MKVFAFAFVAVSATTLCAQAPNANSANQSGFSVPILGFVSSQSPVRLQPILGIPGSARLGSPLSLPNTVTQVYIAPGQLYGLVQQEPGNPLSLISLQGISSLTRNPSITPIAGASAQVDVIAFSPTGNSAAIYSRGTNQLQVLTGLPKSPHMYLNASNLVLPTPAQKLAVSDDGQLVLLSDTAGSVYSIAQNGAPVAMHNSPNISALAFVAQSHDSIICDRSLNTISFLRYSSVSPVVVGPATKEACQPEAAASTRDGKTILLACPAQHAVLSIDRSSGVSHVYNVTGTPTALDHLSLGDTFLMSPPDGGTYWGFVWEAEGPTPFFIGPTRTVIQGPRN